MYTPVHETELDGQAWQFPLTGLNPALQLKAYVEL